MAGIKDLATRLSPDMIFFTGDQMDRRESDAELFAEGFAGIAAPMGVWGILGNHDHFIDPKMSEWALRAAGIEPLVNDGVTFDRGGSRIALIGLEDLNAAGDRTPDFSVIAKYPTSYRICLSHQPQSWHQAAAAGAHLTLSGHTHGGQIALTGQKPQRGSLQHPLHRRALSPRGVLPLRVAGSRSGSGSGQGRRSTGD